jgi:hypothetical protein
MNIQDYTNKCNELADLAKHAIDLEGLDERTKEELQQTRDSILANHYRITLLGSFQSGKSTIFNVACGGRELSPTGIGIRTSAVPAEAHVTVEGQEEYAIVRWKTDRELLAGFTEAILPELRDIDKERFRGCSEGEAIEKLDLSKAADRELMAAALRDARRHLQEDLLERSVGRENGLREGDMVELLKICGLILNFYDTFADRTTKGGATGSSMTVEEASRVVRFPEDWGKMQDPRSFRWEDVQFLFARTVQFFLNSEDLRQLRAVLVDCPGLHASRWDNEIVHHCIAHSDAVIWLQGGEGRELGQSDLEEAKRFGEYGITSDGVFLAFNARGVGKRVSERILDANLTKMKSHAGIDVPSERVVIFNALLALRARQAIAIRAGELSQNTVLALSAKAKDQIDPEKLPEGGADPRKNAEKLISRDLKRQAEQFLDEDVKDIWDREQLGQLAVRSQWEKVIAQATQFIVRTKGRTRLIDKGANLISKALNKFENELEATEIAANEQLDEHKAKKMAAEQSLKRFEDGADGLARRFELSMRDTSTSGDGVCGPVQRELFDRLRKGKDALLRRLRQAVDSAEQERLVRGAIRREATGWMQSVITGWQVDVRAGKSPGMENFYTNTLRGVEVDIRRLLEDAIGQSQGLLRPVEFEVPKPSEQLLNEYQADPLKKSFRDIDLLLDTIEGKLPFLGFVRDGYEALRRFFTGKPFDRDAWKDRLQDYWVSLLGAFDNGVVEKVTSDFLESYSDAVIDCIDKSKVTLRAEYRERLATREAALSKKKEERHQLAERAKDIRKRVIKPFQKRLEEFVRQVQEYLRADAPPVATDKL